MKKNVRNRRSYKNGCCTLIDGEQADCRGYIWSNIFRIHLSSLPIDERYRQVFSACAKLISGDTSGRLFFCPAVVPTILVVIGCTYTHLFLIIWEKVKTDNILLYLMHMIQNRVYHSLRYENSQLPGIKYHVTRLTS